MRSVIKAIQAAAGNAGEAVYVDDVFSTYLYDGTGSSLEINNGIDLSGEGGLVWIKGRNNTNATQDHRLIDTERGVNEAISSAANDNVLNITGEFTSFDDDGFTLASTSGNGLNRSGEEYCSWTFRNQPGFFEVVKYEGNGTAGRTVSHNLGSAPGCIIVKRVESGQSNGDFFVYHRGNTAAPETERLKLNSTATTSDTASAWNDTAPTATEFTLGSSSDVNASSNTYIAYLFAHDDQSFGEDSDEAIIKCGSYQGNGDTANQGEVDVNVGFEPQWVMIKRTDGATADWMMIDMMRRFAAHSSSSFFSSRVNLSDEDLLGEGVEPTPTGFRITNDDGKIGANAKYVYIAIRRPHKPASEFAATKLFNVDAGANTSPGFDTGFPVDMGIFRNANSISDFDIMSRITEARRLDFTNGTEANKGTAAHMDYMDGWSTNANNLTGWAWRRAPGYFDVLTYKGGQSAGSTVNHNLGVVPEMMWVKNRDNTGSWVVKHKGMTGGISGDYFMYLDSSSAEDDGGSNFRFNPSATQFTLSSTNSQINNSTTPANEYMAYLFATVDGISKVGSYSGTGSDLTIDCGFTNGARFVLVKSTTFSGGWHLWDSVRGITTNNDPYLLLHSSNQQATSSLRDIEPDSSGFIANGGSSHLNSSGQSYIFYAIA